MSLKVEKNSTMTDLFFIIIIIIIIIIITLNI